jgi:hypothetical protein
MPAFVVYAGIRIHRQMTKTDEIAREVLHRMLGCIFLCISSCALSRVKMHFPLRVLLAAKAREGQDFSHGNIKFVNRTAMLMLLL